MVHAPAALSIGDLDNNRLMVGCGGRFIDLDAADAAREIFGDENKIAAIRAIGPLRAIVDAAGRRSRLARMADVPCIAIVKPGAHRAMQQRDAAGR